MHIKLGLMKQYVKSLDKSGKCFSYITRKFPALSSEKIKAGIFDGPQIRRLIKDPNFTRSMTRLEAAAWNGFVRVVKGFLGGDRARNYQQLVTTMLTAFKAQGARMSIKVYFLFDHLDGFHENLRVSEEQGERLSRHQGDGGTLSRKVGCGNDGRWRETAAKHDRKSRKRSFAQVE